MEYSIGTVEARGLINDALKNTTRTLSITLAKANIGLEIEIQLLPELPKYSKLQEFDLVITQAKKTVDYASGRRKKVNHRGVYVTRRFEKFYRIKYQIVPNRILPPAPKTQPLTIVSLIQQSGVEGISFADIVAAFPQTPIYKIVGEIGKLVIYDNVNKLPNQKLVYQADT